MNQPVREKTDADATGTNHLHVTSDILWKTSCVVQQATATTHRPSTESRRNTGFSASIHRQDAHLHGGFARGFFARGADFAGQRLPEGCARNERPVRGDNRTGQAIWALGVDGRSRRIQPRWGGITAPTYIGRSRVGARSNRSRDFFDFLQGLRTKIGFRRKFIARRGDRLRRRPIYPTPWRPPAGSGPVSGEPAVGSAALSTAGAAKPRRPAPPARR